jgi:hypothetical protein
MKKSNLFLIAISTFFILMVTTILGAFYPKTMMAFLISSFGILLGWCIMVLILNNFKIKQ